MECAVKEREGVLYGKGWSVVMNKDKKEIATILISLVMLFLCGCASQGANTAGVSGTSVKPASDKNLIFPVFELPIPQSESEKSYLGISGTGNFRVGQIKTHVLIVRGL
jgi:hypothetical protein